MYLTYSHIKTNLLCEPGGAGPGPNGPRPGHQRETLMITNNQLNSSWFFFEDTI